MEQIQDRSGVESEPFRTLVLEQVGYFSLKQAREVGVTRQLVAHHHKTRRFERALRGVYRDTHHPRVDDGELVALWLWSECAGVFSHQTALYAHGLSDALPTRIALSVPCDSPAPGRTLPRPELRVHAADFEAAEITWCGHVPMTGVVRTLSDCILNTTVSPELLGQAIEEARHRELISERERIESYIRLGFVPW